MKRTGVHLNPVGQKKSPDTLRNLKIKKCQSLDLFDKLGLEVIKSRDSDTRPSKKCKCCENEKKSFVNYKKTRMCTTCRRWFQKLQQGDIPENQLKVPKLKRWQKKPVAKTTLTNINRLEVALENEIFPKGSDIETVASLLLEDLKARTQKQITCAEKKETRKKRKDVGQMRMIYRDKLTTKYKQMLSKYISEDDDIDLPNPVERPIKRGRNKKSVEPVKKSKVAAVKKRKYQRKTTEKTKEIEKLPKLPKSPVKKRKYHRKTAEEKLEIANRKQNAEYFKLPASPKRKRVPRKLINTDAEKRKKKRNPIAPSPSDIFADLKNECSAAYERLISLTLPSDEEIEACRIDQNPEQIIAENIVMADAPTEIPDLITTG